jgi:hypothetical protein
MEFREFVAMLEANQISFRYAVDGPWLFQGPDIDIKPGEIVGLPADPGLFYSTRLKNLPSHGRGDMIHP